MVNRIVGEIYKCLDNECYIAALALALTLPDICGKAEYPNENSRERYSLWFDTNIGQYERERSRSNEKGLANLPFLSGELLYALRCDVLHSGEVNINGNAMKEEQNQVTEFNLVIPPRSECCAFGTTTSIAYNEDRTVAVREYNVDIPFLCKIISNVALEYYQNNASKFEAFRYHIIDRR